MKRKKRHLLKNLKIETMGEALIVVDNNYSIIDYNNTAKILFPKLSTYPLYTSLLQISVDLYNFFCTKTNGEININNRFYEIHINNIYNQKDIIGFYALILDNTYHHMDIANIAHEIRTPLSAVLSMTELILKEPVSKEVSEYALSIINTGKYLLHTMDHIIDLSKIETGYINLKNQKYNLLQIINEIAPVIKTILINRPIKFTLDIMENIPVIYFGDELRIRQILINLLSNAVKFTKEGEINLSIHYILEEETSLLSFTITDTGYGIEDKELPFIFSNFERSKHVIQQGIQGNGLGLAIIKKIVDAMNGTIRVESNYGGGSTFHVTIPQLPMKEPISKISEVPLVPIHSFTIYDATILIVDDNALNRKVIHDILKLYNIQIVEASNGAECLSQINTRSFDIIFLDYKMPVMDGLTTLKIIRNEGFSFDELPIIALTANAISGIKEQLLEYGFNDYLSKPIDFYELERVLLTWIKKDKILSITNEVQPSSNMILMDKDSNSLINFEIGLNNCGKIKEYYIEAIELYCSENLLVTQSLKKLFQEKNLRAFEIQIHGIKAASRTLGALPLAELAFVLEQAAKENNYSIIIANLESFFTLNLITIKEFKDYLDTNP